MGTSWGNDGGNGFDEVRKDLRKEFESWRLRIAEPIHQRFIKVENDFIKSGGIKEKTEILAGTRNRQSIPQAAVRYQDMRHIAGFPSVPTARKATGSTVPVEQYNRLVDDMNKLYAAIGSLASVIGSKTR